MSPPPDLIAPHRVTVDAMSNAIETEALSDTDLVLHECRSRNRRSQYKQYHVSPLISGLSVVVLALGLAGCGKRGELLAPPLAEQAPVTETPNDTEPARSEKTEPSSVDRSVDRSVDQGAAN